MRPPKQKKTLAELLTELRRQRGWTISQASRHTGVPRLCLRSYEVLGQHPALPTLKTILKAYGKTVDVIDTCTIPIRHSEKSPYRRAPKVAKGPPLASSDPRIEETEFAPLFKIILAHPSLTAQQVKKLKKNREILESFLKKLGGPHYAPIIRARTGLDDGRPKGLRATRKACGYPYANFRYVGYWEHHLWNCGYRQRFRQGLHRAYWRLYHLLEEANIAMPLEVLGVAPPLPPFPELTDDMPLGKRLRALRQYRGYSQKALGQLATLSFMQVHYLETGQRQGMQLGRLVKLAQALEVKLSVLVGN